MTIGDYLSQKGIKSLRTEFDIFTEFINGKFQPHEILTQQEKSYLRRLNAKNNYGLNDKMLLRLAQKHKKARSEFDVKTIAKIEYRLTDINFHNECALLHKGDYGTVYRICANWR